MTVKQAERPTATTSDWSVEEVQASRPRVRRDILYTQVPEGVLFHDATTGFRVHGKTAYRFATLMVPFLDGRLMVSEMCAGLGDAQRAMVHDLVRTLYRRGFARAVKTADPEREPVVPAGVLRRFDAQISYVDHHVDDAEERFARFRSTRVAIVGDDEIAGWAALSLLRNGAATIGVSTAVLDRHAQLAARLRVEADDLRADDCPVELRAEQRLGGAPTWADLNEYDVVVVAPGDRGVRTVLDLLEAGVPAGRLLLPAWRAGTQLAIGPLMGAVTRGCWVCAALRVGGSGDAGAAADLWREAAGLGLGRSSARTSGGPLAAMVGNLLAYEIFRLATGVLPAETDGKVIVQDTDSLDVAAERLLPHPECNVCGPPTAAAATAAPSPALTLEEPSFSPQSHKPMPEPGGPESQQQLEALRRQSVLVGRRLGTFVRFDDDALPQTPLRVSTVELAVGSGRRRRIVAFDVHNVVGARLAALAAAAGVYADQVVPAAGVLTAEAVALAGDRLPTVAPAALGTHTGLDPAGETVSAWVPATSLTTGRITLVPAGAVAPHGPHNDRRVFSLGSAGQGVDDAPDRARGAALLSALGYDALRDALHGRSRLQQVDLGEVGDDPVLTFLTRTARNLDVEPDLIELGPADQLPAPVLLARCVDPVTGLGLWTVAADTSWRAAAVTALRDLLGRVQYAAALPAGEPVDAGDPLVTDLDPHTLVLDSSAGSCVGARQGLVRTFPEVLDRLRRTGAEALVVDRGATDLTAGGLSAARVLIHRPTDAR